jgi:hypothetical protein
MDKTTFCSKFKGGEVKRGFCTIVVEFLLSPLILREELNKSMSALTDLQAAVAAVAAQLTQLTTDVNNKLAADAAALAEAQASAVSENDVASVTALGAQVAALEAVVNPAPAATEAPTS